MPTFHFLKMIEERNLPHPRNSGKVTRTTKWYKNNKTGRPNRKHYYENGLVIIEGINGELITGWMETIGSTTCRRSV